MGGLAVRVGLRLGWRVRVVVSNEKIPSIEVQVNTPTVVNDPDLN